jgi:SAM-dependent methyltransferase
MIYEDWKQWPESGFLKYSDHEATYFDTLVRKLRIRRNAKVLEIGFGNGGLLGYMRSSGRSVYGVETNKVLIDRACGHGVTCYEGLSDVPSHEFDYIFLIDVLEHVNQSTIPLLFEELERLLTPQGAVVLRSPNGHSPLGLSNQYGDPTHVTVITIPKIELWLQSAQSLRVTYGGWDLTPASLRKPIYSIKNLVRMAMARVIEKIIRLIFRPQPAGLLSSNLLVILKRKDDCGGA